MSTTPNVELVNPPRGTKGFAPGERIITVDGVAWGRTYVEHHGCHGTSHTFHQQHGETIGEARPALGKGAPRFHAVTVRSQNKRFWRDPSPWRPTEEAVLEKARELVAAGKLKHPDVELARQAAVRRTMQEAQAARDSEGRTKFRAKAIEALGLNQDPGDSLLVDKVVAAMEWAQSQ